jgi:hypothetical protein
LEYLWQYIFKKGKIFCSACECCTTTIIVIVVVITIIIIIIIILNSSKAISGQETNTNVGFVIWLHVTSSFPESPSPPIKT